MSGLKSIIRNERGNALAIFALSAIPVLMAVCGALEFTAIAQERQALQNAVDQGALAGAGRLTMLSDGVGRQGASEFATFTAQKALQDARISSRAKFQAVVDQTAGTVTVNGTTDHIALAGFMDLGNATLHATATAETLASVPLCILQTGTGNDGGPSGPPSPGGGPAGPPGQPGGPALKGGLSLNDGARIRATGCAVHANQNIAVNSGAMIQASRTQAVGVISGPISPQGYSGAMTIADPFANMPLNPPTTCAGKAEDIRQKRGETVILAPGVHCEHYKIEKDATLILLPGEHYFMDHLDADDNAVVQGDDVVPIFGSHKAVNFVNRASVRLTARKSGPFAGFLIVTTRANTERFTIASSNVSELLGTIYIPNAELVIETTGSVAQDSAWSIIVADHLVLRKSPSLVINSGYIGSGVPVPDGVGPSQSSPKLTR